MSRILAAEDDPHILRVISMWLRRQGHEVLEARNGLIARELARDQPVDVLVSDVNMPGLDGLELVEGALRDGRVRRGVIVLTNRWDHGDIRQRLAAWGVQVLPKPFSPTRLSELVDALTSGTGVSPVLNPDHGPEASGAPSPAVEVHIGQRPVPPAGAEGKA
jgi:CheY-like chemotaxis protein